MPKCNKSAAKEPFATFMQPSCSHYNAIHDSQLQNAIVLRMQPAARGNLYAAIPLRSADTELQNTIELCTTQIAVILQLQNRMDLDAKAKKTTILKRVLKGTLKGKSSMPNQKICCFFTIHTSHAAITMRFTTLTAARSNLDAAIPLQSADTE